MVFVFPAFEVRVDRLEHRALGPAEDAHGFGEVHLSVLLHEVFGAQVADVVLTTLERVDPREVLEADGAEVPVAIPLVRVRLSRDMLR